MTRRLPAALPATLVATACLLTTGALAQDGSAKDSKTDEQHVCPEGCDGASCVDLEALLPKFKSPDLWFDDEAPKLHIAQFIKGDSVEKFEEGRTYVVEFWATWCGPCIRAFPHLSELQERLHEDVTFIGVNVRDTKPEESQDARVERVGAFVASQGDKMSYTVGVEIDDKMSEAWLEPSRHTAIPVAFIVDGTGTIAWIGHPYEIDEPLRQVIAGDYDGTAASKRGKAGMMDRVGYRAFVDGVTSENEAEAKNAYVLGRALAAQVYNNDPMYLTFFAAFVLYNGKVHHRDFGFALGLAHKACEVSEWEDARALDAYAFAQYRTGDVAGAIKTQTQALELNPEDEDLRERIAKNLELFRADD